MADKKEPMIGQENRPTAIDYDAPIANFKLRDLHAVIYAHLSEKEVLKVEKEVHKPEKELFKPEKEFHKPEKELFKPEKEFYKPEHFKPEKEILKPELTKPEKTVDPGMIDQIATKVAQKLKGQ